jgi:hypothetical protein
LYGRGEIGADTIADLRSLGLDIYIVVWEEDIEYDPLIETRFARHPEWFAPVFSNPAGTVYRLINDDVRR